MRCTAPIKLALDNNFVIYREIEKSVNNLKIVTKKLSSTKINSIKFQLRNVYLKIKINVMVNSIIKIYS